MEETEKYQTEVEQTEENPFENQNGTPEGQALLDEGFVQIQEEIALEPEDYQTDLPLFDTVEGAQPVEVFETGTLEGDSGGEDEKASLIENMDAETIQKGFDLVGGNNDILNDIPFKQACDIPGLAGTSVDGDSPNFKPADLDKGWPDPPERVV